jgi:hypothetical protein
VGPCRSLHVDDWIGRVVGVLLWWGWVGCRCVGAEGSRGCRDGRVGRRCDDIQGGFW